jgi:hypothetical protein
MSNEAEELSLIESQIEGLLGGDGASEDPADVLKFLITAGLRPALAARVHKAIVCAEVEARPRPVPKLSARVPDSDEMKELLLEAKSNVGIEYIRDLLEYGAGAKRIYDIKDEEVGDMVGLLRMFKRSGWPMIRPQVETKNTPEAATSTDILQRAAAIQRQRAQDYDQPSGERSMGRTVEAFNVITQRQRQQALTESEGWQFMAILKMVRDRSTAKPHVDSIEDMVAYISLFGEARLKE